MQQQIDQKFFSITESYSPRYRKGELKHMGNFLKESLPPQSSNDTALDSLIPSIFDTLNTCIGNIQELFKRRMLVHEEQILQIAHSQIKKMQEQSQRVIKKYSQLIKQKNLSHELLDLKYEVLYFQKRASDLFDQNKALKEKIKRLKDQIVLLKIEQQSDHIALRNISKKYLKEKTLKLKLLSDKKDMTAIENSNKKLLSLSKVYNPQEMNLSKTSEKGKSQPTYFGRSDSSDRAKNIKIKLKSLKPKPYMITQP